ncbi:unnamed protein product, partial [Polarella glacialis]
SLKYFVWPVLVYILFFGLRQSGAGALWTLIFTRQRREISQLQIVKDAQLSSFSKLKKLRPHAENATRLPKTPSYNKQTTLHISTTLITKQALK